jgi:hypothetical protein
VSQVRALIALIVPERTAFPDGKSPFEPLWGQHGHHQFTRPRRVSFVTCDRNISLFVLELSFVALRVSLYTCLLLLAMSNDSGSGLGGRESYGVMAISQGECARSRLWSYVEAADERQLKQLTLQFNLEYYEELSHRTVASLTASIEHSYSGPHSSAGLFQQLPVTARGLIKCAGIAELRLLVEHLICRKAGLDLEMLEWFEAYVRQTKWPSQTTGSRYEISTKVMYWLRGTAAPLIPRHLDARLLYYWLPVQTTLIVE